MGTLQLCCARQAWPGTARDPGVQLGPPLEVGLSPEGVQGQVGELLKGQDLSGGLGSGGLWWDDRGKEKGPQVWPEHTFPLNGR